MAWTKDQREFLREMYAETGMTHAEFGRAARGLIEVSQEQARILTGGKNPMAMHTTMANWKKSFAVLDTAREQLGHTTLPVGLEQVRHQVQVAEQAGMPSVNALVRENIRRDSSFTIARMREAIVHERLHMYGSINPVFGAQIRSAGSVPKAWHVFYSALDPKLTAEKRAEEYFAWMVGWGKGRSRVDLTELAKSDLEHAESLKIVDFFFKRRYTTPSFRDVESQFTAWHRGFLGVPPSHTRAALPVPKTNEAINPIAPTRKYVLKTPQLTPGEIAERNRQVAALKKEWYTYRRGIEEGLPEHRYGKGPWSRRQTLKEAVESVPGFYRRQMSPAKEAEQKIFSRLVVGLKSPWAMGAIGLGLAGAAAWMFSGRDDEYNTITGMQEGGSAARMRQQMTDFGSGYQGLPEEKETAAVSWPLVGAGAVAMGWLTHPKELWINRPIDAAAYIEQFRSVGYQPGDIIWTRNVLYDDPFHAAIVGIDKKIYETYAGQTPATQGKAVFARYDLDEFLERMLREHRAEGLEYPLYGVARIKGLKRAQREAAGLRAKNIYEQVIAGEISPEYALESVNTNKGKRFNCLSYAAEAHKESGKRFFKPGSRFIPFTKGWALPWNLDMEGYRWLTRGPERMFRPTAVGKLAFGAGFATAAYGAATGDSELVWRGGLALGLGAAGHLFSTSKLSKILPTAAIVAPGSMKAGLRKAISVGARAAMAAPAAYGVVQLGYAIIEKNFADSPDKSSTTLDTNKPWWQLGTSDYADIAVAGGVALTGYGVYGAITDTVKYDPKSKRILALSEVAKGSAQGHRVPVEALQSWVKPHGWEIDIINSFDDLSQIRQSGRAYRAFLDAGYLTRWVSGLPGIVAQWDVQSQSEQAAGAFRLHIRGKWPGIGNVPILGNLFAGMQNKGLAFVVPDVEQAKGFAKAAGTENVYAFNNFVIRPEVLHNARAVRAQLRRGKLTLPFVSATENFVTISGGGKGFGVAEAARLLQQSDWLNQTNTKAIVFAGHLRTARPDAMAALEKLAAGDSRFQILEMGDTSKTAAAARRLPEYMAAAKVNIGVPGASTIAEAIAAERPFLALHGQLNAGLKMTTAGIPQFSHFATHGPFARKKYGTLTQTMGIPGLAEPGGAAAREMGTHLRSLMQEMETAPPPRLNLKDFDTGSRLLRIIEEAERKGQLTPTRFRPSIQGMITPLFASAHFKQAAIMGLGIAAVGGIVSLFSGKDDEHNTIEGMREGGIAARMRRRDTDFGSGYQGPEKSNDTIDYLFGAAGIGGGYLLHRWSNQQAFGSHLLADAPGLTYDPNAQRILLMAEEIPGGPKGHIASARALKAWMQRSGWETDIVSGGSVSDIKKKLAQKRGAYRAAVDIGYEMPWPNQLPAVSIQHNIGSEASERAGTFRAHINLKYKTPRTGMVYATASERTAKILRGFGKADVYSLNTLVAHPSVIDAAQGIDANRPIQEALPGLRSGQRFVTISGGGNAYGVSQTLKTLEASGWLKDTNRSAVIFTANLKERAPEQFADIMEIVARDPSRFTVHNLSGAGGRLAEYMGRADVNLFLPGASTTAEAIAAKKPFIGFAGGNLPPWLDPSRPGNMLEHTLYARQFGIQTEFAVIPNRGSSVSQAAGALRGKLESVVARASEAQVRLPSTADFDVGSKLINIIETAERRGTLGVSKAMERGWLTMRSYKFMAAGAAGAIALTSLFSGSDDEYNEIEGMHEGGIAAAMRKENTDFGSGLVAHLAATKSKAWHLLSQGELLRLGRKYMRQLGVEVMDNQSHKLWRMMEKAGIESPWEKIGGPALYKSQQSMNAFIRKHQPLEALSKKARAYEKLSKYVSKRKGFVLVDRARLNAFLGPEGANVAKPELIEREINRTLFHEMSEAHYSAISNAGIAKRGHADIGFVGTHESMGVIGDELMFASLAGRESYELTRLTRYHDLLSYKNDFYMPSGGARGEDYVFRTLSTMRSFEQKHLARIPAFTQADVTGVTAAWTPATEGTLTFMREHARKGVMVANIYRPKETIRGLSRYNAERRAAAKAQAKQNAKAAKAKSMAQAHTEKLMQAEAQKRVQALMWERARSAGKRHRTSYTRRLDRARNPFHED